LTKRDWCEDSLKVVPDRNNGPSKQETKIPAQRKKKQNRERTKTQEKQQEKRFKKNLPHFYFSTKKITTTITNRIKLNQTHHLNHL